MSNPGRFFVIEGTDGTGKTVQSSLLIERLQKEGFEVVPMDFPQYGKNAFADTVAAYLRNEFGNAAELNPYLSSFPYAADRWKASFAMRPALEKGAVIVSNRYTSANMGHQGGKIKDPEEREKFLAWLKELEFTEKGFNIPTPDMVILLYLKPEVAQLLVDRKAQRDYAQGKKRDGHEADINHLRNTAETFRSIAETESNWKLVDCTSEENNDILPPEAIHEKIWQLVKPLLQK